MSGRKNPPTLIDFRPKLGLRTGISDNSSLHFCLSLRASARAEATRMGITKTMDEDIYQKHVAMSIFYCGNFIQTLGTTERVHNLKTSRSICLLLFCIMFLRLVFILCRLPALPLYSNVEMIHGCLYISTVFRCFTLVSLIFTHSIVSNGFAYFQSSALICYFS